MLHVQPPLATGMHLRWAFERELGFPWWGFYLFRRPSSREGERTCLSRFLGEAPRDGNATVLTLPAGTLSSDLPLRATDEFPEPGLSEIDLGGGRGRLQMTLPQGKAATETQVRIGIRRQRECVDFRPVLRAPAANPLRLQGLVLEIDFTPQHPSLIFPALRLENGVVQGGLRVTRAAVVHFDDPVTEARLLVAAEAGGAKATAYATDGAVVASAALGRRDVGTVELVLASDRPIVRVVLERGRGAMALLQVCRSGQNGEAVSLKVVAQRGPMPVASALATGKRGEVVDVTLEADQIDRVQFLPADGAHLPEAALVDLCYVVPVADRRSGWQPLPDCPQPLALPVFHPDYPASGKAAIDRDASENVALPRIHYGNPAESAGQPFTDLHDCLVRLVQGGPVGPGMADPSRAQDLAADAPPPGSPEPPELTAMHPLDLVLLASLNPAAAQMLGLYFIDRALHAGERFDYLVIGDWSGVAHGDAHAALGQWIAGTAGYEGYILPNKQVGPVPPLAPPDDPRAYSLPASGSFSALGSPDAPPVVVGLVGLHWTVPTDPSGPLLPQSPVMYHLWREALGDADAPAADPALGDWLTDHAPILVGTPILDAFATPQRPADWPDLAMHRIDAIAGEGWYAYRVSGMDIFGRISSPSPRTPWHQWAPPPDPLPWYYQQPPGDRAIHSEAIRILDKTPPPPPAGVEAAALDPADPYLVADASYTAWRTGLPRAVRDTLVGLRVTWRWTVSQIRQAPDTREFRIYFNPGGSAPLPDAGAAANWQQRVHVVAYEQVTSVAPNGDRLYRLFLPVQNPQVFADGVPLAPSVADPISYAHVGVSAADGAPHSPDDVRWAASPFGNRAGNEGRFGVPAKIFRVLRQAPRPPVPPADAEKVFATAADYHGQSFYTYRWVPQPHLKAHVLRAMDNSLFAADRRHRPRPPLAPDTAGIFPDQTVEPRWDATKRGQVADELNALNGLGDRAAATAYRALSNDALRVLAGLPGNEEAFVQVTVQPLDPGDPATANHVGPDNPPDFPIDPALRRYLDTLDGRGTNRYFYRAVYVDGAHNRSAPSLSGPPIWLPNVVPPRAPVLTRAVGGERRIELAWASNREQDLAAYRVYGTDDPAASRDHRAMRLLATIAVGAGDPSARPASLNWAHEDLPGLVNRWYAITAVDVADNESADSRIACARAFDEALPVVPPLTAAWTAAVPPAQAQVSWSAIDEARLERRVAGSLQWDPVGDWRPPGAYDEAIALDPSLSWRLRLRVRKYTGALVVGPTVPLNHL
ncbi:hypothetical protein ACTJLB_02680 [Paraburkholderia sp. 22098]|uniref:hypothetical protein n=1 Tax=Paraburkholderia sp. 22098 TaxID=3453874 RepID=UPI003F82CBC9